MYSIILGSTSPYKRALLEGYNISFTVEDSGVDEKQFHQDTVEHTVRVLAEKKAEAIIEGHKNTETLIITTDVAGDLDGKFLGKPESLEQAQEMIMSYSGKEVLIWCGTTVVNARTNTFYTDVAKASVQFAELNEQDVVRYVQEKKPIDKGGAIAIEEIEERGFIQKITGEYDAIIGISMKFVLKILQEYNK